MTMDLTPVDIKIKGYMREFLAQRLQEERQGTAFTATGFVLRGIDLEKFLDAIWLYINRRMLEDQNGAKQSE